MTRGQVIAIKLPLFSDRCRSKAMQIATKAEGTVVSVNIQGTDRDHLVVIGEGIDSVNLTRSLRKKFSSASIVSVRPITSSPERSRSNHYDYNDYRQIDHQQHRQWLPSSNYIDYPRNYGEAHGSGPSNYSYYTII